MRVLLLTQYYLPELTPGSFRIESLVKHLRTKLDGDIQLNIITTMPSRYANENMTAEAFEQYENVKIERITVPSIKTSMLSQIKSYIYFAASVLKLVHKREYDLVFATSSRLMTACLASYISRRKSVPLYLDIRDIFIDGIQEVLPRPMGELAKRVLLPLENLTFKEAKIINLVSRGFEKDFKKRYPDKDYRFFTNGIDQIFIGKTYSSEVKKPIEASLPTILYAGNLGDGQAIHEILPALASQLIGRYEILIIGNGKYREKINTIIKEQNITNMKLIYRVSRRRLIQHYKDADILFLHLNSHKAFEKVLPSKIFEYASTGKPIIGGVSGYAKVFIETNISNAEVFEPLNVDAAISVINKIDLQHCDRSDFIEKFSRDKIMERMAVDIISLANEGKSDIL